MAVLAVQLKVESFTDGPSREGGVRVADHCSEVGLGLPNTAP
jgi:hypothetical protein